MEKFSLQTRKTLQTPLIYFNWMCVFWNFNHWITCFIISSMLTNFQEDQRSI